MQCEKHKTNIEALSIWDDKRDGEKGDYPVSFFMILFTGAVNRKVTLLFHENSNKI